MINHREIISYLQNLSDIEIAAHSQRYFKTGKGEYGYGDKFLGIRVPELRKAVKLFQDINLSEIKKLLKSEYHELRLIALLLMVHQFKNGDINKREKIYNVYLKHTKYINNWDLVDSSASYIVGAWLFDKDRSILYELAQSSKLWERRIAIISTAYFIKNNQFTDTLKLSKILLTDSEDLIHKAVGWMLREVGKINIEVEEKYLKQHYKNMPRTMLRYAIEKFSSSQRQDYLKNNLP